MGRGGTINNHWSLVSALQLIDFLCFSGDPSFCFSILLFLQLQLSHRPRSSVNMSFTSVFLSLRSTQQMLSLYVISTTHTHTHTCTPFKSFFFIYLPCLSSLIRPFLPLVTCLASFPAHPTWGSSVARMTLHTHTHLQIHTLYSPTENTINICILKTSPRSNLSDDHCRDQTPQTASRPQCDTLCWNFRTQ